MEITRDHILQLGQLAKLELTEGEVNQLVEQLPKIVEYVSQLQKIDTTQVAAVDRPASDLRRDTVADFPAQAEILEQAPERAGQNWKVDAVFS